MDQVKEILKQAIKYRFWIALGVSLLVPALAYAIGSGPVKDEAAKRKTEIESAKKDVEQYANGVVPNKDYRPIVDRKTTELSKDVRNAWQKLYDRQAPLLTWPERVQERFTTWGRKWPDTEDASRVQFAIIDYVQAYPKFVTEVYNSFRPFDYAEGTGIVAAPPENTLLRPAPFSENSPPDLGKVWAAQERLWIQRSLLSVIAEVNKNAKTWDAATIKQIKALEVGSQTAQDQVSIADNVTLAEAEAIVDPKAPPPPEPSASDSGMPGMPTMSGPTQQSDAVFYLAAAEGAAAPYKIMPVEMAVLIEQDHIADYLSALENSPMSIQVKEFALSKPGERVTKPEKGQSQGGFGFGGYGGYGMPGLISRGMGGRSQMTMFGGNVMQRMPGMASGYGAPGASGKGGVDKRSTDRRKKGAEDKEDAEKTKKPSLHDPYFNIVEVTFYGQVRFYNPPPPPEPSAEPASESPGQIAGEGEAKEKEKEKGEAAKTEEKAENEPAKEGEMKKEGEAPAEKDEAAKKDEGDAPKKDEAAKGKAPDAKPAEPAKEKEAAAPKADEAPKNVPGAPASKP